MSSSDTAPTPEQHRIHAARARDDDRRKAVFKLHEPIMAAVPRVAVPAAPAATLPAPARKGQSDPQMRIPGVSSPPTTNREGDSPSLFDDKSGVRLHHLRCTFPVQPEGIASGTPILDRVREAVGLAFNSPGQERLAKTMGRRGGLWSYENGVQWHDAEDKMLAAIFWTEGRGEACVDIRGGGMDQLGPEKQLELIHLLESLGAEGRRLDPAFDDYRRVASMNTIHRAIKRNNITGFIKYDAQRPEDISTGEKEGDSAKLGRRDTDNGSGKYMRIYDKFLESGRDPNFDCIRYELELSKEHAEGAFKTLAASKSVEEMGQMIGRIITEKVDFVERKGYEKHISRAPRLAWWTRLTALLAQGPIIHVKRLISTLSQSVLTMRKQWGKVLALANVALQSAGEGFGIANVVQQWAEKLEDQIPWAKQQGRDLSLSLNLILAT